MIFSVYKFGEFFVGVDCVGVDIGRRNFIGRVSRGDFKVNDRVW